MKKIKRIMGVTMCALIIIFANTKSEAACKLIVDGRNPMDQPIIIRTTCYTAKEGAITSSGTRVRPGIIAGKKEWQGFIAFLYTYEIIDGNCIPKDLIGIYEVLDTGAGIDTDFDGKGDSIIDGTSIDVFQPTLHQAEEWVDTYGDYTMLLLVEGEG